MWYVTTFWYHKRANLFRY